MTTESNDYELLPESEELSKFGLIAIKVFGKGNRPEVEIWRLNKKGVPSKRVLCVCGEPGAWLLEVAAKCYRNMIVRDSAPSL